MSFIAAAIIGGAGLIGSVGSAFIGASASEKASQQQQQGLQQALGAQQGYFNQAQGALSPFYSEGENIQPVLNSLLTPGPSQTAALSQLPGFQFANTYGQIAARNQGTTMGLGGNTIAAGANYATGLAQQYFSNFTNPLLSLYQTGGQAAGSLAGTAQGFGQQATTAATGIGQAQAAGTLGAANAISGGLTGGANTVLNSVLLSRALGGGNNNSMYGPGAAVPYTNAPFTNAF